MMSGNWGLKLISLAGTGVEGWRKTQKAAVD
jgi:hypothetical protein